jgi:hypothetical protein
LAMETRRRAVSIVAKRITRRPAKPVCYHRE